jgi:type II secretory pathway component PulK
MKIHLHRSSAGVALIIVMIAILVLAGMAAILAYSMKVESKLAHNSSSDQRLVWLGRSGVELARWVLVQGKCPYDSLNQIWAGGPGSDCETNGPLAGFSLNNYQVGDGTVSLKIVDLERYANINTAGTPELQQALTLMGVNADSISVVSDSIQDWVQPGDMPRVAGAKSDYYQGFNPPYNCKEAPIDDMSELLLVKGILDHPEIYWGGSATNHQPAAFQRHQLGFGAAPGQTPDYPFGLKDLFMPFSIGRININTADANVLQLIPGVDANVADAIMKLRAGPDQADGTADDTPIPDAGVAGALRSAGDNNPLAGNFATGHSSTFQVTVTAQLPGFPSRDYKAILYRNGPNVEVVSFYWQK